MTKSEIAEEAWLKAALRLEEAFQGDDPIARHVREKVIPSLRQRARIIARNRKVRP